MAAITIFLDRKGSLTVVAGAAGLCLLHFGHRLSFILLGRQIEFDVAVAALKHARVQLMAEFYIPRIFHLEVHVLHGMALRTFLRLEGSLPVMADAAGLPFLHLGHGDRFGDCQIVNLGVADTAFILSEMLLVTEDHGTRFFYFNGYFGNFMALDAILQTKGPLAVMTCATGFAFSHIRHGVASLVSEVENGIMTGFTVSLDALLPEMLVMVEYHLAEVGNFEGDVFDINRICHRAREYDHDQE